MNEKYTDEEILEALREHPHHTIKEWREDHLLPSVPTIQNRFGTWNEARKEAGIGIISKRRLSEEEKKERVLRAMEENNREILKKYGETYCKIVDGWALDKFREWTE